MDFLFHLITWVGLAGAILLYRNEQIRRRNIISDHSQKLVQAEYHLSNVVEKYLGKWEAENIQTKVIWVNMPKCLLLYVKGKPGDIKESVSAGQRQEMWLYGASTYRYAGQIRYRYSFQIIVENDIVKGWQDL